MNNTFKKKGAVEMSLNLIIMLIIGMVVLGLVIGFVNSLVGQGVSGFEDQIGENEQLKLDKVSQSPENLAVEPAPSLKVNLGEKATLFLKLRAYDTAISCDPGNLIDAGCELTFTVTPEDAGTSENFIITGPGFNALVGEEDAQMYTINPQDTAIGTYYLQLNLYGGDESKSITVSVR
jgi:hypothetical protein